ncbi:MAG: hypothetical protein V1774_09315, partial [Candidatus Eisenbacteria bacterium]
DLVCEEGLSQVFYIVSNFYETKTFTAIEYGIDWTGAAGGYIPAEAGVCAPASYNTIPTTVPEWPEDGSGIAIALNSGEWSGTCVPTTWIGAYFYCSKPGQLTLMANPTTGDIGWLSGGLTWDPAAIGALGNGVAGIKVCSEAPPEEEACCFPDGRCVMLFEADCDAQGGIFYGGDCAVVLCPQPPEACCFPDGSCAMLLEADCATQGGVFYHGEDCATFTCPQPPDPEACCFEDGHCEMLLEADCIAAGGAFYGGDCAVADCPQPPEPEACCIGVTCVMLLEADCLAQSGVFYAGEDCATFTCPLPPEPEACCFEDGHCEMLLEADCIAAGGDFYGGDCAVADCPQPPEPMACCLEDGTCVDVYAPGECDALGGELYETVNCTTPGFACPLPPEAACCIDYDETCYMLTEAACLAQSGTWNEGMDCATFTCPLWRVCCVGNDCYITTEGGCAGMAGVWHPEWTDCTGNPCYIPVPSDPESWGAIKSIYR